MVKETELIFIPVPSTGHLLVNIEFAKRLINLNHGINTITIIQLDSPTNPHASVFARSLVASQPQIRLHSLPVLHDPPPSDLYKRAPEAYIVKLVKKTTPLIKKAVSSIVESRSSDSVRVAGLVLDFFCNSLIKDVGNELNLPSYIFLTCNARYLCMMKYLPDRHRKMASKLDWSSGDEELPIPGFVNPIPTKFMPPGLFNQEAYEAYVELSPRFAHAKGILVNSIAELEPHPFAYFSHQDDYPPVYPVGPILSLDDRASPNDEEEADRDRILRWLEDQPESSVVFLCFGSKGSVDEPQVKEIAQALEIVGCRFLWSIRTSHVETTNPSDVLPEGFMGRVAGRGLVCGWAPQVEVLAHKAIGGFVSHCGWNSTLESLWFGVPVATWPMYAEQQLNAFTLVKELGLAVDLRMDYVSGRGGLVTCGEIVRAVRSLMDGGEGKRLKVKEMANAARKAKMDGRSSTLATARFMAELLDDGSC